MKLLKPKWVIHENNSPIFSIDIHPDGSRFATGGQAPDSGKVVIWNMAPVVNQKSEMDENIPKMLCQMDNHEACVNCVRWSHSGRFLASGGDDKLIMVWKINPHSGGNAIFGSKDGMVNVESWRCASTLRGHDGDVLDLAWSSHDGWLASCSIDNTVIVWNALKFPETVAVLKGHSGLVKGVSWDPVGKYLASQSEDRTLRVWRTVDWKEEKVIKEPFEKCAGSTHVLRLNWSPDGEYLVSAHAMNGPGPTAQIIDREGWTYEMDFVGHRKPVTCVRFNSVLFRSSHTKKNKHCCCCAIGSRDLSISIWLTYLKRPLVVLRELFSNSVLDLSWSTSGFQLMACSWDGTVAYIEFSEEELGKPLSKEEKIAFHEKKYGKSLLSQTEAYVSRVVETAELLQLQEKSLSKPTGNLSATLPDSSDDRRSAATPIKGPINKQIETRTSDGRRRITPMFIPPTPDRGDTPQPFNSGSAMQPTFSSAESKSCIVIEKREDIVKPNVAVAKSPLKEGNAAAVVVNGHGAASCASDAPQEKSASVSTPFAPASFGGKRRTDKEKDKPNTSQSSTTVPTSTLAAKRARFSLDRPTVAPIPIAQGSGPLTGRADGPGLVLPSLKSASKLAIPIEGGKVQRDPHWAEVDNGYCSSLHGHLSRLRVVRHILPGQMGSATDSSKFSVIWETVLGFPVIGIVANMSVICVACEDSTLHVFDFKTGWHRFPPFVLTAPASRISLNSHSHIMVVTASGHLTVWDLAGGRKVVSNESLLPVMGGSSGSQITLLSCSLSENNIPMISLSTGKAFIFSNDLGWLLVGNSHNPVSRDSIHQSFLGHSPSDGTSLPLACLQSDIRSCGAGNRLYAAANSSSSSSQPCSLAFLDEQLAACRATMSPKEYQYWLLTTARFLVHHGLEDRLRQVCEDLLGPTHKGAVHSRSWERTIMGLSKHNLLKEVLRIVSTNLRWQRLWSEYTDQLRMVEGILNTTDG